jgi:hypothetical protein
VPVLDVDFDLLAPVDDPAPHLFAFAENFP